MDVFGADSFTAMDLSANNTTLPSLGSSTAADGLECTDGDLLRAVPMAKRKHSKSPEFVEPRRRAAKSVRAFRLLSSHFAPLARKKCMRTNLCWSMEVSYVKNNGWSDRSSLSGLVDGHEYSLVTQSGVS